MLEELSEDLLEEILCRVPALSLKRLRYTCKRWNQNRLFNDKRFTTNHLEKAPKQLMTLMSKDDRICLMRINHPVKVKGELSLIDTHSKDLGQVEIIRASHCDGLLFCLTKMAYNTITRLVVWNPCTGQTKWIQPRNRGFECCAIGSYQDKKSDDKSYKILTHRSYGDNKGFEICEINSNSWRRILDVTFDFSLTSFHSLGVSLNGKTYWIAEDKKQTCQFLISFDYTRERFERLCPLPRQYSCYRNQSLSVVRDEKLSVLLQRCCRSKTEVWVTNKIGETKVMSWSMVLAVDLDPGLRIWSNGSFLVDEEKKELVCCDNGMSFSIGKTVVCIVGEDNIVKEKDFGVGSPRSLLFHYVPSLTRI